jgi:hypothetical protein
MPEETSDPISSAGQGANWLVGLSGAAIGGALAKMDWVMKFPPWGKVLFFVAFLAFMVSILVGVYYAFELLALKSRKLKLMSELAKNSPVTADISKAQRDLDEANAKVSKYHIGTMVAFGVSCFFTAACLCNLLVAQNFNLTDPPPKPVVESRPEPNRYSLTDVSVTVGGHLSHTHTFLLDQLNGRVWQMTCKKGGETVSFQRVLRTGLDGKPDEIPPKAPSASTQPASPRE